MIVYLSKAKPSALRGVAVMRLDFNTEDEWRMRATLPTIRYVLGAGARVVILSHRGRPNGFERKLSLRNDGVNLARFLRKNVTFIPHFRFAEMRRKIALAPPRSVFLLENLRFLRGEERNDRTLAKRLASLGRFYVNDAFAVSHRDDASVDAITRSVRSYAGFELENEIKHLSHVMGHPKRPLVAVFGGGKAHDKLKVMRYFKKKADTFIVGGAPANTVLKIYGLHLGHSVVDKNPGMTIEELVRYKNLVLPIDYHVKDKTILDIGPKTARLFAGAVKRAGTVIWSGPLGVIEDPRYARGTLEVARAMARNTKAFTLAGGGETVMFLKKHRLDKKFSFISTGGGAMLEFLAGEKLPGIEALKR